MSTTRTGYVILGVELAEFNIADDKFVDDELAEACEEVGLDEVHDGMNGNYHIVGNVIQKAQYDSGDCAGAEMTTWKMGELARDAADVAKLLTELLGVPVNAEHDIKLFSFTYWG